MADNEIINIGDICVYSFKTINKSVSIVEVVKELSDECVVVKFHQVIFDDSGNGLFTYLCSCDKTMNVSKKFLTKIDLVQRLNAENTELRRASLSYALEIERLKAVADAELDTIHDLGNDYERVLQEEPTLIQKAKAEAISEFMSRIENECDFVTFGYTTGFRTIDVRRIAQEMTNNFEKGSE